METHIIDRISNVAAPIDDEKSCSDDDFVDRVNHTYTMNLLMFFTAVVLSRQLIGKPISCWIPNDFTGAQGEYAETVCWVTSTYFIPPSQATVPIQEETRYEKKIFYYQWVPFILMIQAALFVVPCIIWRLFNSQARINLRTVMEVSRDLKCVNDSCEQRRDLINCLVRHLEDALAIRHFRRQHREKKTKLSDQRQYGKGWSQLAANKSGNINEFGVGGRRFSTPVVPLTVSNQVRVPGPRPCAPTSSAYLCGLYLVVKALYLANSTLQLFLTGKYLNGEAFIFGIEVLRHLMNTRFWDQTGFFPRVALCDFELRRMGSNQHRYTIQCVLRINIFNEKIYIFLWFWFLLVSVLNLVSLLRWYYKLMFQCVRVPFIRNLICIYFNFVAANTHIRHKSESSCKSKTLERTDLSIADIFKTTEDLKASKTFSEDILGQDGVLLLRFIGMNLGAASAAELAGVIWIKYQKTVTSPGRLTTDLEELAFRNLTTGNGDRGEDPPAVPLKQRRSRLQKQAKNPALFPLNSLIRHTQQNAGNDSDRSSESSRPSIEMLQERRGRRPVYRRRGDYESAEDELDEVSAAQRSCAFDEFLDSHVDPVDTESAQEREELMSEYQSFEK